MKRKLLFIIATVFLVAACHNDDYMPGLPAPGNEDNETEMAEQVAGRVALGYVTYYGTSIPDAKYLTHINYAFAELLYKNSAFSQRRYSLFMTYSLQRVILFFCSHRQQGYPVLLRCAIVGCTSPCGRSGSENRS